MLHSFVDIAKRKLFVLLALLFTLALNITLEYKLYTLLLAQAIVILFILHHLKVADLLFKEKGEKMANNSETQNLKNTQPLARNEIQTFIGRIIETPVNDENTELFKELKKILDNKLGL